MTREPDWRDLRREGLALDRLAIQEHAWLLRAEGLRLKDIGLRLGVGAEQARKNIDSFARRMTKAVRATRIRTDKPPACARSRMTEE